MVDLVLPELRSELAGVLRRCDSIWSQFFSGYQDNEVVINAIGETRSLLKHVVGIAGGMYETNIECVSHILRLQKENSGANMNSSEKLRVSLLAFALVCNASQRCCWLVFRKWRLE